MYRAGRTQEGVKTAKGWKDYWRRETEHTCTDSRFQHAPGLTHRCRDARQAWYCLGLRLAP